MLHRNYPRYVLYALALVALSWQFADVVNVTGGIVDPNLSTVSSASGVLFSCPGGDGDRLGDQGLTITATLKDNTGTGIAGVPASDIWLVGCTTGLALCSNTSPFTGSTGPTGRIVLNGRLSVKGCDNSGVRVKALGTVIVACLPIQVRTADLKSSGAPGPPPCGSTQLCPDGLVDLADFNFFMTLYPQGPNPNPPYFPCADLASPYGGTLGLSDFSKFVIHYLGVSHHC